MRIYTPPTTLIGQSDVCGMPTALPLCPQEWRQCQGMDISSGIAESLLMAKTPGHWQAPVMVGVLMHLLSDQAVEWAYT